jgi:hypothetical protein
MPHCRVGALVIFLRLFTPLGSFNLLQKRIAMTTALSGVASVQENVKLTMCL